MKILFRLIVIYQILPETEGRTLQDIEIHFADDSRKITDHHIARMSDVTPNNQVVG